MKSLILTAATALIVAGFFLTASPAAAADSAPAFFPPSYTTPQCWGKSAADARSKALQDTANFWKQFGIDWKITAEEKDHEPWKPGIYDYWHVITSEPK